MLERIISTVLMGRFTKGAAVFMAVAISATTLLSGCNNNIDANANVVSINGGEDNISLGYANFAAKYQQTIYDFYYNTDGTLWTKEAEGSEPTMEENVKDGVMESIQNMYLARMHASEYDSELTDEDIASIEEAADKFMADNSEEAVKALGATRDFVIRYLQDSVYLNRVAEALEAEAEVSVSDEDAVQTTISYVELRTDYITGDDGASRDLTDEELRQQELYASQIGESEDFTEGANAAGAEVKTYTFTASADPANDSTLPEEVLKAALGLQNGEKSGSIHVPDKGYYVVRMDARNDAEATANKRKSLEEEQRHAHYTETFDGWREALEWTVDEAQWAKVKFTDIFEPVQVENTEEAETEE